jgi:spore coat protein U-like protein
MVKRIILIVAIAMIAFSGVALADTNTVTVTANVVGSCHFAALTSNLSFGLLDQTLTTDATATASTAFWCTRNTAFAITDDDGLNDGGVVDGNRMRNGSEYIPYSFSYSTTGGTGAGKTAPTNFTITGTIVNANYVDAVAGNYSDTVVISINP